MKSPIPVRRAALLGAVCTVAACDVLDFVANPMPRFEQTWNLPVPSTNVSVASLLPADNSVQILADSSAFVVTVGGANINRRVGNDCAQCEALNGTNAFKPAFVLSAGNSAALPADVVTAAVSSGSVNAVLTNNMSFDPLFVRTGPAPQTQGYMLIVIRSGSLVLGRDSVNGANTTFPPATQMTRVIPLTSGGIANAITTDVTINSPQGDHNEFINADGTLNAIATVPFLHVASVGMNVPNRPMDSASDTIDLAGVGAAGDRVVRGALEMNITNPFAVNGTIGMQFAYAPGQAVTKTVSFPSGANQIQRVQLDSAEMALLMGNEVEISVVGTVTSTSPITVTPRQAITIGNRLILTIRTGGGN